MWVADKLSTSVGITLKMKQGEGFAFVWACLYVGGGAEGKSKLFSICSLPECILLPFMYVVLEVLTSLNGVNFVEAVLSTVQHKVSWKAK